MKLTPQEKASKYLRVLKLREKKELSYREMAVVLGFTYQRCHQLYDLACKWREQVAKESKSVK